MLPQLSSEANKFQSVVSVRRHAVIIFSGKGITPPQFIAPRTRGRRHGTQPFAGGADTPPPSFPHNFSPCMCAIVVSHPLGTTYVSLLPRPALHHPGYTRQHTPHRTQLTLIPGVCSLVSYSVRTCYLGVLLFVCQHTAHSVAAGVGRKPFLFSAFLVSGREYGTSLL